MKAAFKPKQQGGAPLEQGAYELESGYGESEYDESIYGLPGVDPHNHSPFTRNDSWKLSDEESEALEPAHVRRGQQQFRKQDMKEPEHVPVRVASLAQGLPSIPSNRMNRIATLAHGVSPIQEDGLESIPTLSVAHAAARAYAKDNRQYAAPEHTEDDYEESEADFPRVNTLAMPKVPRANTAGSFRPPPGRHDEAYEREEDRRQLTAPAVAAARRHMQDDAYDDETAQENDDAESVFRVGKLMSQLPPIRTTVDDGREPYEAPAAAAARDAAVPDDPYGEEPTYADDDDDIPAAAKAARAKRPGSVAQGESDWKIAAYRVDDGDIIDVDGLTSHLDKMTAKATSDKALQKELANGEGLATALDALHLEGNSAATLAAKVSACNLLNVMARLPDNAPRLIATEVVDAVVPQLKSERHGLRHAALQVFDCLSLTISMTGDSKAQKDNGRAGAGSRATDRGGSRAGDRAGTAASQHGKDNKGSSSAHSTALTKLMKNMGEAGALRMLLSVLRKSSANGGCLGCAQRAASLLYTLTSCDPAARDEVVSGGGVEGLLRTLQSGDSRPRAQHAAARLLLDLAAASQALSRELVDSGAVPVLAAMLRRKETAGEILFTVAATLKYLCEEPVAQWVLSEDQQLLEAVVRMINSRNPYLQVSSTRLVARLANVLEPESVANSGILDALTWAGRLGDDKRRIMGHTARSACALSLCQILVAALDTGDDISASSEFVKNQKVKASKKDPQLIVEALQKIPGILPLMLELLAEGWEDFRPMSVSILSVLAASEDLAVKMSESDDLLNTLTELLASKNQVSEMGAARTLTELGQCNPDVVVRLLEEDTVLDSVVLALRRAGQGHSMDPKSVPHKLTLSLLSLLDCLSNDPELLGTRHAWRMVSNSTLMRSQVELMLGYDPVAAQSAARLIYNVSVFRAAAVEAALVPDLISALLSVASASLRPPPPGAEHLVEQVTAASHTALCAIARLVSHGSRTATSELLTMGVVPLLAGMVHSKTTQLVLRRASLVALVDLCQGHEDNDEEAARKKEADRDKYGAGKWSGVEGEANMNVASDDILVQAAREQLVMMQGVAALSALIQDDEEVSGSTATALIEVLETSCPSGRRAVVDHKFASLVRKHFLRSKDSKAVKA